MKEKIQSPAKRVAIYIRVSTDEQVDGYGADAQKDAVLNLIKSKENVPDPLTFAGEEYVYYDDGVSGRSEISKRAAFMKMKEAIVMSDKETRPFDAVAVYRIDRFARKLRILLDVIDFFEENEIEFLSVTENIDTSNPFGRAILSIIGVIAELEIDSIRQRTRDGRIQAIKAGVFMGRSAPYGYKKVEKELEVFKEEAQHVSTIFDLFVNQKYTIGEIANYLRDYEVLSPSVSAKVHGKRKGVTHKKNKQFHWSHETVRRTLGDEIYIGNYWYEKTEGRKALPKEEWKLSPYTYPSIIDDLTFAKAQKRLIAARHERKVKGNSKYDYLLSRLLRCDYCIEDRKFHGTRQHWHGTSKKIKKSGRRMRYYKCGRKNTTKYDHKICTVIPMPAKQIEAYVIKQCIELLESPVAVFEYQRQLKSEQISLEHIEKRIEAMNDLMASIPHRRERLLEQHKEGFITKERLKADMEELNASSIKYREEIIKLRQQIAENSLSEHYIKTLDLFNKKYSNILNQAQQNKKEVYHILHMLIEEIVIYSRPVVPEDKIAGRKKEDQQIPCKIHIKFKLPQDILSEIAAKMNPAVITEEIQSTKKASSDEDAVLGENTSLVRAKGFEPLTLSV